VAVFHAVFVDQAGDFYIEGAVFGDFKEGFGVFGFLVFLPPADGDEAVGGFAGSEGGGCDVVEFEETSHFLFYVEHHIETDGLFLDVRKDVGLKDGVVEAYVVPAYD